MDYKNEFYKTRITQLCDSYKTIVHLSILASKQNRGNTVILLHQRLSQIYKDIVKTVETFDEKPILNLVETKQYEKLPSNLEPIKLIDSYNKLLALSYTEIESENPDERLKIIRLCLDFDYAEPLHSLSLAKFFLKNKKYREAILLSEYLTTVTNIAPPYLVIARAYSDLKMYAESIDAYNKYLLLNENDVQAENELNLVYEEMLGLK